MHSFPCNVTLAVFTIASAASIAPTNPLVSTMPRASMGNPPVLSESSRYHTCGEFFERRLAIGAQVINLPYIGANNLDGGGAGGAPALQHAFGGEAGEDADQRDAASGGDVAACGIVAHVQLAFLNVSGEAGERAFPHGDAATSSRHCALHSMGFFAAGAFVDEDGAGELAQEFFFERIGDSFVGIFANSEAYRTGIFVGGQSCIDVGPGIFDRKGLCCPAARQSR